MSLEKCENRISIAKLHYANNKAQKSLELTIPKKLSERHKLENRGYVMLVPCEDGFTVRKLIIPTGEDKPKQ